MLSTSTHRPIRINQRRRVNSVIGGLCLLVILMAGGRDLNAQSIVLDAFESGSDWRLIAADGVLIDTMRVPGRTGQALQIHFKFVAGAGYGGIQKQIDLNLPENYQFSFYLAGVAPNNNLEFKLLDATGDNVWWRNQRNFEFPQQWKKINIKQRQIEFAWGPTSERYLRHAAKLEIFIASSSGGEGWIRLDDLQFETLAPRSTAAFTPLITASSAKNVQTPVNQLNDGNLKTAWRSSKNDPAPTIFIDLQKSCEVGGVVLDWDPQDYATQYTLFAALDTSVWTPVYEVRHGRGGRRYLMTPELDARYLKLVCQASRRNRGYVLRELTLQPLDFSRDHNAFFNQVAQDFPRGYFPKYFNHESSYWTVVGAHGDPKEALINQEGLVEVDKNSFALEPVLFQDGHLITWENVQRSVALEQAYLPIPAVHWEHPRIQLETQIFAAGPADSSVLFCRYQLTNPGPKVCRGNFYLLLRPFQVNPPYQFLNQPGGWTPITEIQAQVNQFEVNLQKRVYFLTPADAVGATEFDAGDIIEYVAQDGLPSAQAVHDQTRMASAAAKFAYTLAPQQRRTVYLMIPFHENQATPPVPQPGQPVAAFFQQQLQDVIAFWEQKVHQVEFQLPPAATKLVNTLRSNLAYILINRDYAGIQPGSRSYERSWMRDGALTSAALLKMGLHVEVKAFLDWFSRFQYPNGKIPCVVDHRGADPVPENDSHGQYIYAIGQYFLFTGDTTFLAGKFENVQRAVAYIRALVNQRSTDYYRLGNDSLRAFYGLMPESISHEGYSAKPMHSYWDDFFTLRGLKDAVWIAQVLKKSTLAESLAVFRDQFKHNLYQSLALAMKNHGIDYMPGCVELGDFDATSTTIALSPVNELANLPQPYLQNTFDKYYHFTQERTTPESQWVNYTPYELRTVGSFILLNQPERARQLLAFFFGDQRPPAWNHWAEVVWRDPHWPGFIGDMPHTWVGSDFINSVRSFFAYEDETRAALVLGAGLDPTWIDAPTGIAVRGLPTIYGKINYALKKVTDGYQLELSGDLKIPSGGIIFKNFKSQPPHRVTVNGSMVTHITASEILINTFPATIMIEF